MRLRKGLFSLVIPFVLIAAHVEASGAQKCPGRVEVLTEKIKPQVFNEYVRFSGRAFPEKEVVRSSEAGLVSEVKVVQGSAVGKNQELATINKDVAGEVAALNAEAAKRKKALEARMNWKVKSERAIKTAEARYQEALAAVEKKKALSELVVVTPVAGTIKSLTINPGQEISKDAVLLEIENLAVMTATLAVPQDQLGLFTKGENITALFTGAGEVSGVVADVTGTGVVLIFNNGAARVSSASDFTMTKLKKGYENAVVLAPDKILKDEVGNFVYVAVGKKARKTYVTSGPVEGNMALVLSGLLPDSDLILSGFDCLRDGKNIKIMNEVKEAKAEASPQSSETRVGEVATDEDLSRFRIGLIFGRYNLNDANLTSFYGHKGRFVPGAEVSIHTKFNIDLWASYEVYADQQKTAVFGDTVKFKMTPLSIGLRYRPLSLRWRSVEPFFGAGLDLYSYSETISGESGLENTHDKASGFYVQGGYYFHAKSFRFLLGEVFMKYNVVKKTLAEPLPEGSDKLDLGGFEIGIGLVVKF